MLVVMVIGVSMAVVIPNLRPANRRELLAQASRRVVGMLRMASAQAISQQRAMDIELNFSTNTITMKPQLRAGEEEERPRLERRRQTRERDPQAPAELDETLQHFSLTAPIALHAAETYQDRILDNGARVLLTLYPDAQATPATIILRAEKSPADLIAMQRAGNVIDDLNRFQFYTIEVARATSQVRSERGLPKEDTSWHAPIPALAGRREDAEQFVELARDVQERREARRKK